MTSLGLLFILLFTSSQHNSAALQINQRTQPAMPLQLAAGPTKNLAEASQDNTCYTVRSYLFHQHDGQAPIPAGMTTCTPANTLQQRRVSHSENSLFMPLGLNRDQKNTGEQTTEQKRK